MTRKNGRKEPCMDVYFRDDYIEINPYTGEEMGVYNPYAGEIIPLRKMRRRKHSNPYEYETQGFEPYE
jgi:predicted RNA-binding Zn-ribbon protein involved in translation (DUF1610 family)